MYMAESSDDTPSSGKAFAKESMISKTDSEFSNYVSFEYGITYLETARSTSLIATQLEGTVCTTSENYNGNGDGIYFGTNIILCLTDKYL